MLYELILINEIEQRAKIIFLSVREHNERGRRLRSAALLVLRVNSCAFLFPGQGHLKGLVLTNEPSHPASALRSP